MATLQDFGSAPRRELAQILREQPRTLSEIALALGRPATSIAKLVQRMHRVGLLVATPDPPTRGSVYALTPEADRALGQALKQPLARTEPATIGRVQPDGHLLLIDGTDEVFALNRILADPELTASVAWAAETDTRGGLLLAMAPGTTVQEVHALYGVLRDAGIQSFRLNPRAIQSAQTMRHNAISVIAVEASA
jgi:DNA-binding MarR family transcriptional regulator